MSERFFLQSTQYWLKAFVWTILINSPLINYCSGSLMFGAWNGFAMGCGMFCGRGG